MVDRILVVNLLTSQPSYSQTRAEALKKNIFPGFRVSSMQILHY